LNVIDPESRGSQCDNPKHKNFKEYECRSKGCGQKFEGKQAMEKHRWSHAI